MVGIFAALFLETIMGLNLLVGAVNHLNGGQKQATEAVGAAVGGKAGLDSNILKCHLPPVLTVTTVRLTVL